eukprot:4806119-Pyramimonas_sp.AAC.1
MAAGGKARQRWSLTSGLWPRERLRRSLHRTGGLGDTQRPAAALGRWWGDALTTPGVRPWLWLRAGTAMAARWIGVADGE